MGGYGGTSGKVKDKCYRDSGNNKIKDKNAIEVAEHYLGEGSYVVFLQEKYSRPDLLVDFNLLVEVKGIISLNPGQVSKQIEKASIQVDPELARYPEDKPKPAAKIVLISRHASFEAGWRAISEGYQEAKRKDQVHFQTEFWFHGEIHILE